MQLIKYSVIYLLLLFIENNLLHLISIKNVTPDLILIFVIIISLRESKNKATAIGFLAGLIQDVFTTGFWGLSALTKSIVGFWGVFFQQPKKRYNLSYFAVVVSVLVVIHEIIFGLIYNLGTRIGFFQLLLEYMFPRAIYTGIIALITYMIFKPMLWKSERILE